MAVERNYEAIAQRLQADAGGLLPVSAACRQVPRLRGAGVSPSTLVRWIERGKSGVYLDGMVCGGKGWWTSREALSRFFAALTRKRIGKLAQSDEKVESAKPTQTADLERARRLAAARARIAERLGKASSGT